MVEIIRRDLVTNSGEKTALQRVEQVDGVEGPIDYVSSTTNDGSLNQVIKPLFSSVQVVENSPLHWLDKECIHSPTLFHYPDHPNRPPSLPFPFSLFFHLFLSLILAASALSLLSSLYFPIYLFFSPITNHNSCCTAQICWRIGKWTKYGRDTGGLWHAGGRGPQHQRPLHRISRQTIAGKVGKSTPSL